MPPDSSAPASSEQTGPKAIERTVFPRRLAPRRPEEPKFLRNAWYVAMFASDLPEEKIVHQTILNEPIAFWRREDGGVAAIRDVCPHRFVPLSMGTLKPHDRVQCIYHGLEFGADGQCLKNPHGSKKVSNGLHLPHWTVVEKHTLLWIWMGEREPDLSKIPDYGCLDGRPGLLVTRPGYLNVRADYRLLVDNLLDLSHVSYTHAGILGNADIVRAEVLVEQTGDVVTVSRNVPNAETPGIHRLIRPDAFETGDQLNEISWFAPSNLLLETGVMPIGGERYGGAGYFALHFLTPETARTTHYRYSAAIWGVTEADDRARGVRDTVYRMRTFAFAEQDVPVIEAQQAAMDHADAAPVPQPFSVDAGPLRYQKILERLIAEEG
jgi:phenylpropionate dioxygenase-like ring-hydroxylating dioxygenase large terminal subunit